MDLLIPTAGDRYLAPTGRIWTVVGTTPRGDRVRLVTDDDEGSVVDVAALGRMIPLAAPTVELLVAPAHRSAAAPVPSSDGPATAA